MRLGIRSTLGNVPRPTFLSSLLVKSPFYRKCLGLDSEDRTWRSLSALEYFTIS